MLICGGEQQNLCRRLTRLLGSVLLILIFPSEAREVGA